MYAPFPIADDSQRDPQADADVEWMKAFIVGIRNIRGEMQLPPGKLLAVLCKNADENARRRVDENRQYLSKLAKLESIDLLEPGAEEPLAATALVGQMEILVPMADLIDVEEESKRLQKEIEKRHKEINQVRGKLSNANFVDRAPAEVVEKEKAKEQEISSAVEKLQAQLERIKALQ